MDCALKNKLNYSVHVEDFHAVAWTVILQQKGWALWLSPTVQTHAG